MQTAAPAVFHNRPTAIAKPKLVEQMAEKYGVDSDKMLVTLKQTAFKQSADRNTGIVAEVSNEQMMMLLVVANEYNLNPFTREIYAFASKGGVVPIVSIDGWVRIVNEHPAFRGVSFEYGPPHVDAKYHGAPEWIQCTMHRSDRDVPILIREYLVECYRSTDPWNTTTARMLRHRSYMQCGRMAFGFALHDQDEAERIIEGESTRLQETPKAIASFNAGVKSAINGESTRVDASVSSPSTEAQKQEIEAAPAWQKIEALVISAVAAKDVDMLEAHATLLGEITDEHHRERLTKYYRDERAKLKGETK